MGQYRWRHGARIQAGCQPAYSDFVDGERPSRHMDLPNHLIFGGWDETTSLERTSRCHHTSTHHILESPCPRQHQGAAPTTVCAPARSAEHCKSPVVDTNSGVERPLGD